MNLISIDPAMANCGWAVVRVQKTKPLHKLLDFDTIKTDCGAKKGSTIEAITTDTIERIHQIINELNRIIIQYDPKIALIEDINLKFGRMIRGVMVNRKALQQYSAAWGAVDCLISKIDTVRYIPLTAPKKNFAKAICKSLGLEDYDEHNAEAIVWGLHFNIKRDTISLPSDI
jgi:hypothetical protein